MLRLISILFISAIMLSCGNDNEPTVVAPSKGSNNNLTGTRWIAYPDNLNNLPNTWLTEIGAIEIFSTEHCIIDLLDSKENKYYSYRLSSEYDEISNSITLTEYNQKIIVSEDELITTFKDSTGEIYSYRFLKDNDFESPKKDNGIVGIWESFIIVENMQFQVGLTILDNERLIRWDTLADCVQNLVLRYNFDGKIISIENGDDKQTYTVEGNKIICGDRTYTKQQ